MSGPWDNYKTGTPTADKHAGGSGSGPWAKYGKGADTPPEDDQGSISRYIAKPLQRAAAVANDAVIEAGNAVAGGVGAVADFVAPGNSFSRGVDEFVKGGEGKQSNDTQRDRRAFRNEMDVAEGMGDEAAAVGRYIARSPVQAAAQVAGTFAIPGGAIKTARGAAGLAGLGARGTAVAGTAAGMATGAALSGGDAAGSAYELVQEIPEDVLLRSPEAAKLREGGASVADIRDQLGKRAGRDASIIPAIIGAAGGAIGAEKILATGRIGTQGLKGLLATGAVEAGQNAVEEGATQYEGRRAAQALDPSIDPMKGVGGAATMGGIMGGVTGAGVHALSGGGHNAAPKETSVLPENIRREAASREGDGAEGGQVFAANNNANTGGADPAPAQPAPLREGAAATWRNADHDQPVTLVRMEAELGPDGRRYARVRSGDTESFVPADELVAAPGKPDLAHGAKVTWQGREAIVRGYDARRPDVRGRMVRIQVGGRGFFVPESEVTEGWAPLPDNPRPRDALVPAGQQQTAPAPFVPRPEWEVTDDSPRGREQLPADPRVEPVPGTALPADGAAPRALPNEPYAPTPAPTDAAGLADLGLTPDVQQANANRTPTPIDMQRPGDIDRNGKPFVLRSTAARAAREHGAADVVRTETGFVVRPRAAAAVGAAVPDTLAVSPSGVVGRPEGFGLNPDDASTIEASRMDLRGVQQAAADAGGTVEVGPASVVAVDRGQGAAMQNRDRSRPASVEQMNRIANDPDYDRLGVGRSPNEAAPMVSISGNAETVAPRDLGKADRVTLADGTKVATRYAVVEADDAVASHAVDGSPNPEYYADPAPGVMRSLNNGRTTGIQEAYRRGTADKYRAALLADAEAHGIAPEAIESKRAPMLVRIYDDAENQRPNIGALSNPSSNLGMSATEQAQGDAQLIDVADLAVGENGDLDTPTNRGFLDRFARTLRAAGEDSSRVVDQTGAYSRQFVERARAAVFARAYGDGNLTALAAESSDPDVRNVINALAMSAPEFAKVDASGPLDIRPQLTEAVQAIRDARSRGLSREDWMAQQDMFGRDGDADRVADMLWQNIRSPKRMSEGLREIARFIQNETARAGSTDMFGAEPATIDAALGRAETYLQERYGNDAAQSQTGLFESGNPGAGATASPDGRNAVDHDGGGQQAGQRRAPADEGGAPARQVNGPLESRGPAAQTDTPAFRRWFGDSKVVEANGTPKVVYHGAPDARFTRQDGVFRTRLERAGMREPRRSFFFAADLRTARTYADPRRAWDYQAAEEGIVPAYLSMQNPLIIDAKGEHWRGTAPMVDRAMDEGYDGAIIQNVRDDYASPRVQKGKPKPSTTVYVVFNPEQIKSATSNNGNFDPGNPDIRESRPDQPSEFVPPDSPPRAGISLSEAQQLVDRTMAGLPGAELRVSVVRNVKEIPQAAKPSPGAQGAFYRSGHVYLVAENLPSMERAQQVLAHEVVGHHGVEKLLGDKFQDVLRDVRRLSRVPDGEYLPPDVDVGHKHYATMEAVAQRYPDLDSAGRAAEVLARMAETNQRPHFMERVYGMVRQALRKLGFDIKLSAADIRQMVIDARRNLERAPRPVRNSLGRAGSVAGMAAAESRQDSGGMPFTQVDGAVFGDPAAGIKALRDEAKKWAGQNLAGKNFHNDPTGWDVQVSQRGIRETLSRSARPEKVLSMAALPELLKHGVLAKSEPNRKKDRDPFTRTVHTMYAPVQIGGADYVARLIIKESDNGHLFYDHDLSDVVAAKRPDEGTAVSTPAINAGADRSPSGRTMTIEQLRDVVNAEGRAGWGFGNDAPMEARGATATGVPPPSTPSRIEDRLRDSALGKIGAFAKRDKLSDRVKAFAAGVRKNAVQGVFDQFVSLAALDQTAYMQARLSKGTDGAVEAAYTLGPVKLTDGALDVTPDGKGLAGHLQDLKGEHDYFLAWVAGNRADRLAQEWTVTYDGGKKVRFPNEAAARADLATSPGATAQPASRERLFTPEDIEALKRLATGKMKDGRSRADVYGKALRGLNQYQKSVLDVATEAGLIDGDSRHLWESEFYVPFYRVMEDSDGTHGPGQIGGLVGQRAFKELKGGKEQLGDLLGNTLSNWSHLLGASMKNLAAQKSLDAAVQLGIASEVRAAEKGSVRIMDKGQERHFLVEEPQVLDALQALNYTMSKNILMKAGRTMKQALTTGVTISPTFKIRNLARDVMSAIATNEVSYNPVRNLVDGWRGTGRESATYARLLAGGGAIRFGSLNDGDQARNAKRLIDEGLAQRDQIIDTPERVKRLARGMWNAWNEFGDRTENVNRAAIYNASRGRGESHLVASFEARDLMDFTMTGKWEAVRTFTQLVPFLNARLQGMYKLGRSASNNPFRFAAVTGAVGLASALLYLTQRDDEEYQKLPDWVRNTYWPVRVGDTFLYIPKPFEVGALGSVIERGTELAVAGDDYQAADFAKTVRGLLADQLSMDLTPQLVKPVLEAKNNRDAFRDTAIDSPSQERLPAGERYTSTTSAGAIGVGRALDYSPQRIEHLVRGYFGWLGTQALNVSDLVGRSAFDMPSNPRRDLTKVDNWPFVGDFAKQATDPTSSKYVQRFYDMQREIDEVYAVYTEARKAGEVQRARELAGDEKLKIRGLYERAGQQLTKLNREIRRVNNDGSMSPEEKRLRLEPLNGARNRITAQVDQRARAVVTE